MKETNLKKILRRSPCRDGLETLLKGLKFEWDFDKIDNLVRFVNSNLTTEELEKPISTRFILKNNGVKDAVWALCVFAGERDWWLFKADVAESVLHVFEEKFPKDKRPRRAIEAIRKSADGKISKKELKNAAYFAYSAYGTVYNAAIARTAYNTTAATTTAAAYTFVTDTAAAACAVYSKWKEIEQILLKYI